MSNEKNNAAVLFVDISDSTHLYETLGDTAAFSTVRGCISMFEDVIRDAEGRVVKGIGDGLMCAFPAADAAVSAACEMQTRLMALKTPRGMPISIQIGIHFGAVLSDGNDIYGDTVNLAARMVDLAAAGQIITTEHTYDLLSPVFRETSRHLGALPVKGKHGEVAIYEILWQAGSDHTMVPTRMDSSILGGGLARLVLEHKGKEIAVALTATMGRDPKCDIVLADRMASRRHARIERRKNKFILSDRSSNGTYVQMQDGERFTLRREEMVLTGSGSLSFGHRYEEDQGIEVVRFVCEDPNKVVS